MNESKKRCREIRVTEGADDGVKETRLNEGILLEGRPRIDGNRSEVLVKVDLYGVSVHDGFEWKEYGLGLPRCAYLDKDPQYAKDCQTALEKFKEDWFK